MKELICIVCPRGCHLQVDEDNGFAVTGNSCPRGAEYGRNEAVHPVRTLTSTVRIEGAPITRLPVRTASAIPKALLFDAMNEINRTSVHAPVKRGQAVIKDLLGTGVDVIATRDL
ncbi:MAG: DUF1667 domain-containing protein [Clostridia bacterium]|nr:DUF1667 domain-containing protein [Clostridia bacterium]